MRSLIDASRDADDDLKDYDLEHYDNETAGSDDQILNVFGQSRSLAYYESNKDDPYITMDDNEDFEEKEELQILPTDNMLVTAKVEDEVAHLEIYIYEDEADNLYVHHDIMLPAIPLCVEWLDFPVGRSVSQSDLKANFVAIGTFDPDIEIWDLDTVDSMYPDAILGKTDKDKKPESRESKLVEHKKKRKRSSKINDDYHVDAILSLAANKSHRSLLASSSADKTVKLWDLTTAVCAKSYSHHTDKVCSISWHSKNTSVLLSGSYDRSIVAADMRAPDSKVPRWGVESDVEIVAWDRHNTNMFFVATENGLVHYHDIRTVPQSPELSKPIWKLQAHSGSISSFDINPTIPGLLVTGSTDKEVKLWNIQPSGPDMLTSRDLGVGKVFSTKFAPDREVAFRLAVAGSKGTLQVWDTSTNAAVRRSFGSLVASDQDGLEEKIIGTEEDSSDSETQGGVQVGSEDLNASKGNDWESMDEQ